MAVPAEARSQGAVDSDNAVSFAKLVLDRDAAICEVNQRAEIVRHKAVC